MKKTKLYTLLLTLLITGSSSSIYAQFPGQGQGGGRGNQPTGGMPSSGFPNTAGMKIAIGHIYGKVVDSLTRKGVGYASVALYKFAKDTVVSGQLTKENGDFSLENLEFGAYKLKISFVGYKDVIKRVTVTPNKAEYDIGNIPLNPSGNNLTGVTITADRPLLELKPDRKVYNIEKDLSVRGGTGVDVMKNIPGVSTDADGNVTLRNLTPQIYVDGKPTTLTLEQIPADQIDRIEVITNPSAQFDASTTGGILNIILKKNRTPGYNGIVTLATGTNSQYNGTALLNVKEEKFGFMLSYTVNSSGNYTNGSTQRTNLFDGQDIGNLSQTDAVHSVRTFQNARVGFDYYINNRNTISITQNGTFGNFNTYDNQQYATFLGADTSDIGNRISNQLASFHNYTTDLSFRHTYPTPDKEWTLDFNYNRSQGINDLLYVTNDYTVGNIPIPGDPELEEDNGHSITNQFIAQWDFADPVSKTAKFNFGLRSFYSRQYSYLSVIDLNDTTVPPQWIPNPLLSNNYRIDNMVNAGYVTFGQTIEQFSYQLGLRVEQTYYQGLVLNESNSTFSYQYPTSINNIGDCLFPSLNISHKFGDKHEIQFNATRKTNRPSFFQLSPFIFASDKFDYRIGNPALAPEFDNKVEANYNLNLTGFNWLSSVYGTYNQQPITQYSYTEKTDSLVLISTYINAKNSFTYGWENTFKITPIKGLDITLDGNIYYISITSNVAVPINGILTDVPNQEINNTGYSWTGKALVSYKFPLGIIGQVNGTYEAPRIIPQGNTLPQYYMDASVSKDLGYITFTYTVSDVFNTRSFGTYYDTPTYIQTQIRRRDPRYARLSMTVRFGKMDSSIFKLKKKAKEQTPDMNGDEGF